MLSYRMLHSLRHRASAKRKSVSKDLDSSNGRTFNRLKSKPCLAVGPRDLDFGGSNASSGYKCCIVGMLVSSLLIFAILQSTFMMGDGYSSNGGVIGELVDRSLLALYDRQISKSQRAGLIFPDVQVKATRRMERAHYSSYLGHILRIHGEPMAQQFTEPIKNNQRPHNRVNADIVQLTGATASFAVSKANDLISDLRKEKCHSNWLCQRCLNAPFRGTYEACAALCRRCYIRIISSIPGRNDEPIRISGVRNTQQIPRIIHQAWHFYPNSFDYPELSRLMARWRNSDGYDYFFYNGYHEQDVFVNENFPPIVGKALNSVTSRLSRLAFFRLLVLYKVGGVFADGTYETTGMLSSCATIR